jgi:hypothetical protein
LIHRTGPNPCGAGEGFTAFEGDGVCGHGRVACLYGGWLRFRSIVVAADTAKANHRMAFF